MRQQVTELAEQTNTYEACTALAYPRSSYYRQQQTKPVRKPKPATPSPRALPVAEREAVRDTLNSERFVDSSPRQVYGTLLDEGEYLCSVSTMYRILRKYAEVRERRNQKRHPAYKKPELVATAPIRCGPGTLPSCGDPSPMSTITCTPSSISIAAMWWAT